MVAASAVYGNASPTTSEYWRNRFLTEAPLEWRNVANAIGHCEVRQSVKYESFIHNSVVTADATSTLMSTSKVIFDASQGATRGDIYSNGAPSVAKDNTIIGAVVSNKAYEFQVGRGAAKTYRIERYHPLSDNQTQLDWEYMLQTRFWELLSANVDEHPLSDIVQGIGGSLESVEPIEVDGKQMVRLSIDRLFLNSHKPYRATAIVDPQFHWAVRSFRQELSSRVETGSITYHEELSAAAFPKLYIEERYNLLGQLTGRDTYTFETPQPSHAKPADFTLEAFGLTEPKAQSTSAPSPYDTPLVPPPAADAKSASDAASSLIMKPATVAAILGLIFYGLYLFGRKKKPTKINGGESKA